MTETTTTADEPAVETDEPEAPERTRRTPREWLAEQDRTELLIWGGLIAAAFILRIWNLGARPFHHDESQDAYFSYTFYKDFSSYTYNPLLHGPLRFYLTALNYKLFGDSNFTARLAPAYMGTLLVALPFFLRHQLGRVAAIAAGVILAVSPSILYFSRFAREDIYLVALVTALTVTSFRFLRRPGPGKLTLIGVLISLCFATKESGLVAVALIGGFFVLALIVQGIRAERFRDGEVITALRSVHWSAYVYAITAMLATYSLLFTVFFQHSTCTTTEFTLHGKDHPAHPTSCLNAVFYGIDYWRAQQAVARGGDKAWLYISILFGEEWPVMLLAAVGTVFAFLRPTTLRLFLVWIFVTTLAFYCWGSERFAWLVIHPLVPAILLAGLGFQALWQIRARVPRILAMVGVALSAAYLVGASYSANAKQGADPRSLLVSTQSSVQVKEVSDKVLALAAERKRNKQPALTITIDSSQGATFPYAWYFRHQAVGYIDMTVDGYVPNTQVLIMTLEARDKLKPNLSAYAGEPFDFRVWWVKTYKLSASRWWHWLTERKAWDQTGGMPEWLYYRRDLGPLPKLETKRTVPLP